MKSFNYFAMSLAATAMISFASCSSNDDLAGNNNGEAKVDGFYMTLSVQTAKDNGGSRTVQQKDPNKVIPTTEENNVSEGTLYLVDANNKVAFSKFITITENGAKAVEVPVQKVAVGATYKAYFLANVKAEDVNPLEGTFQVTNKFAGDYAKDKSFAMFNQNDDTQHADVYTVKFTNENKTADKAAKVNNGIKDDAPIIIERLVARVDKPESASTIANYPTDKKVTEAEKRANEEAVKKVNKIELTSYAISNVANSSNIMQQWDSNWKLLQIPTTLTDFKYFQEKNDFGGDYDYKDGGFNMNEKNYIFENNNTAENATAMYFEYKVTLKADAGKHYDFTDKDGDNNGTFYRYNGVIYTSFQDIFDAYNNVAGLFGGQKLTDLVEGVKAAINNETELAKFRQNNNIEVFKAGKTYYKINIHDQWLKLDNIQRNTVYRLKVNNIFNVGAQVPNGKPDDNDRFFLDVTVSVNPWVLSEQPVDLK